jgi:hypothetical protein
MQTQLRPMSLGEILDRTAQLYRTHFALFAGISALYAGTMLVLNLGNIGLQQLMLHLQMSKQLPWVTMGYLVFIIPLMVIFGVLAVAANNRAVAWVNLDQPATIRGAYKSILPRLGRYIWLTLIVMFFVYVPYVVVFGAYFIFVYVYVRPRGLFVPGHATHDPQSMVVFGLVSLVFVFVMLGALVYVVLMALRYSLAVPASVVEDLPARQAIRRSIELSKGSRGRIFMLALLIGAIQIGLILITQLFFLIAAFKHKGAMPLWAQIAQQVVGFCTNSFIGPIYATGLTLFYYDQRIRKEGFDIEWMMQAAGMTLPPAVPQPEAVTETVEAWPELPELAAQSPAEPESLGEAGTGLAGPLETHPEKDQETPPENQNG